MTPPVPQQAPPREDPTCEGNATSPLRAFDAKQLHHAYMQGDHRRVCQDVLLVLEHLRSVTYYSIDRPTTHALNAFVKNLLFIFTQPDFTIPDDYASKFIDLNGVIANVIAMSDFGTTDPYVRILLGQDRNFTKVLALYSARNSFPIDRKLLFAASPALATQWYFCFTEGYRNGCASENTLSQLRQHIAYEDDRLIGINSFTHHAYFGSTYIDHEHDYLVKQRINRLFQSTALCQRHIRNTPNNNRIGVLTSMWFPRQSVYRSQQPFLADLAKKYDLVLVHLGRRRDDLDTSLFTEVRYYDAGKDAADLQAVDPNDFAMAYFPDVGMSIESIILANMRLAPVQVSNYGHPVSTFGSKIDYWIGGQDTEQADRAREHYSERLVLIPGCAQAPVPLEYSRQYPTLSDSPVVVNCTWSGQKINSEHLQRLKVIANSCQTPVLFQFFPGGAVLGNAYIPLRRSIEDVLGASRVRVMPSLEYEAYMQKLEAAHFAIDAFPFGGYNTAVDLLTLQIPIVTLKGNRFYNQSTAYLLSTVELDELVAATAEEFIQTTVRMIDDRDFRERMRRRLKTADLQTTVLSHQHVPAFGRAIEYILEHHNELSGQVKREAIFVP